MTYRRVKLIYCLIMVLEGLNKRNNTTVWCHTLFYVFFTLLQILTSKACNLTTSGPNLKCYTSNFKLDYPLSNKSSFEIRFCSVSVGHQTSKVFLSHPVGDFSIWLELINIKDIKTFLWVFDIQKV